MAHGEDAWAGWIWEEVPQSRKMRFWSLARMETPREGSDFGGLDMV